MSVPTALRRTRILLFAILATTLLILYFPFYTRVYDRHISHLSLTDHSTNLLELPLPPEYFSRARDPDWCESKYSTAYLEALRDGRQSFCEPSASPSSFDCFGAEITDERKDTFCIANRVSFSHDHQSTSFKLDCKTQTRIMASKFPKYMYNTGLYHLYTEYFSIADPEKASLHDPSMVASCEEHPKYTILLKREGAGNLWHSLLEIFSLYLTIDVLRMTPRDPTDLSGEPFLSAADISSTQILLLDDHPNGPYFDLWQLFAPLPVLRLKDVRTTTKPTCLENVIIPLAGGSNPLWRGDWDAGACSHSELVDTFSQRVLSQYGYGRTPDSPAGDTATELTLTFIDRRSSRTLINLTKHLNNIRNRFPNVRIQIVDFAAFPFAEQVRIVYETDILVGVHGAGMTHAMFLPDGSSVVEILPHDLHYRVFRNLAKLSGHTYFSAHAEAKVDEKHPDWHDQNVEMEEARFIELVEAGIRAVLHRGRRENDVV